jgi:hypothetical protein
MKNKLTNSDGVAFLKKRQAKLILTVAIAALACLPYVANANEREDDEETHYQQINLVSDISGVAQLQHTNLVNAWGLAFGPTGPFWVGDNGTGKATLYALTNDAFGAARHAQHARGDDSWQRRRLAVSATLVLTSQPFEGNVLNPLLCKKKRL